MVEFAARTFCFFWPFFASRDAHALELRAQVLQLRRREVVHGLLERGVARRARDAGHDLQRALGQLVHALGQRRVPLGGVFPVDQLRCSLCHRRRLLREGSLMPSTMSVLML